MRKRLTQPTKYCVIFFALCLQACFPSFEPKADVYVKDSTTVMLRFYGLPKRDMQPIAVREVVPGCPVVIDTSYVRTTPE
jgi:hypothetical protein